MEELKYTPKKIYLNEVGRDGFTHRTAHNVRILSETSLNQMMDHGKTGMVILSSSRSEIDSDNPNLSLRPVFEKWLDKQGGYASVDSDALYDMERNWLKERNAHADRALKKYIHDAGYSYTPVFGGYHGLEPGSKDEYEPSYVIYCYDRNGQPVDFQELKDFALKMCSIFKQESVYVQSPGNPPVYLDCNGNQINSRSSNDFKFNRDDQQFYTTTKRDKNSPKRFTADIVFENLYIPLKPASYNEKYRRITLGEFIL